MTAGGTDAMSGRELDSVHWKFAGAGAFTRTNTVALPPCGG
jgi:hypothetical protein